MVEKLRAKVIENCGVVQYLMKNVVMEILGMERDSSKRKATAETLCRNTINICFQKTGVKEGAKIVHEGSARLQGTR